MNDLTIYFIICTPVYTPVLTWIELRFSFFKDTITGSLPSDFWSLAASRACLAAFNEMSGCRPNANCFSTPPMRYFQNQRRDPPGLTCKYNPPESAKRACFLAGGQMAFLHCASVNMWNLVKVRHDGLVPPNRMLDRGYGGTRQKNVRFFKLFPPFVPPLEVISH